MAERILQLGVLGLGRIGQLHAENIARRIPRARLAAVYEPRVDVATATAARLGVERLHGAVDRLLADKSIDAAVICTPTDTHAELIEQAARAGKAIFCEKPIALDLATIDRALAAVDATGARLQIGFNRRFDPSFRRLHDLAAAGRVGAPHLLRITSRDPAPPPLEYVKASGGLFMDMTIHDFDMARYVMGDEVVELHAWGAALVDPVVATSAGDIDTALVSLRFASGALGAIDNSRRAAYGYDQRVELFGATGCLVAENSTPDRTIVSDADGIHHPLPFNFFMDRYPEAYVAEMREFVDAILDDRPLPVTGGDGRQAALLATASRESLLTGRAVRVDCD